MSIVIIANIKSSFPFFRYFRKLMFGSCLVWGLACLVGAEHALLLELWYLILGLNVCCSSFA